MRRLDAGTSGALRGGPALTIDDLDLPAGWRSIVFGLCPSGRLRPIQALALGEGALLERRRNLLVCAPTGSGKSLVGDVLLVEALRRGQRALLLEPLRALARERHDQLARRLPEVLAGGARVRVRLSTGDVRREGEANLDPPPGGELIVATPERLEAILRQPRRRRWIDSIGAVVIDEAHLLGSARRGPTLELIVASLLTQAAPPRLALLSATLGEPERLRRWLHPCDLLVEAVRSPPLRKEVLALEADESVDEVIAAELETALADREAAALVFVYRRETADRLALELGSRLAPIVGAGAVASYHAGLTTEQREERRQRALSRGCRCLVATTALALGVNLPATLVLLRDTTFRGQHPPRLELDALLQMMGRAGRERTPGRAAVLIRPGDLWKPEALAGALADEALTPLRSSFELRLPRATPLSRPGAREAAIEPAATLVAAVLARAGPEGLALAELRGRLAATLAGEALAEVAAQAASWLEARALAWTDQEGRLRLTVLGSRGARAVLPLTAVAGLGQLLRDLLSIDPGEELLSRWTPRDHLILARLLAEGSRLTGRPGPEAWPDDRPGLLWTQWLGHERGALELLGSLGLSPGGATRREERVRHARSRARAATAEALRLEALLEGETRAATLEGLGLEGGALERLLDDTLFRLVGQARLLELRCVYYHLRERCGADRERVRRVKRALGRMRRQTFELRRGLASVKIDV